MVGKVCLKIAPMATKRSLYVQVIHRGERSNFREVGAGARTGKVAWTLRKDAP